VALSPNTYANSWSVRRSAFSSSFCLRYDFGTTPKTFPNGSRACADLRASGMMRV